MIRMRLWWFPIAILVLTSCDEPAPVSDGATTDAAAASVSAASTGTASGSGAPSSSASTAAPKAQRPLYYAGAIEPADIEGRTLRELSLLRNTIFARVGNKFRRPWLHDHFMAQPWYRPLDKMDESKISEIDRKNAHTIAEYDAALTREALETLRDAVLKRSKKGRATPEDAVELSLLSQRLGVYLTSGQTDPSPTPLEDQRLLDSLLSVEQLSKLSRRDLRILRNTIYARHGRRFDSKVVRGYFATAAWYKPNDNFHDGMLTAIDSKNVRIIRSVEDSLGGPEHENPNYGKDGWFVMA